MDDSAFAANNQATSRRIVQNSCTVLSAEQEDTYQQNALPSSRTTGKFMMDMNFERKQGTRVTSLAEKNGRDHRINLNSHIRTTDVSTVPVIMKPMIALQGYNTRLLQLATMLEV